MRGRTVRSWVLGSACFLLLVLCTVSFKQIDHEKELLENVSFIYEDEEKSISFSLWQDEEDGCYYLFLPSWLAEREGRFRVEYGGFSGKLKLDGILCKEGELWQNDGREELHELEICDLFGKTCAAETLQVLASSELPSLFVEVESSEPLLSTEDFDKKKYLETGSLLLTDENGALLLESGLDVFKVRGNLTAEYSKKPFSLTLEEPAEILGMEAAVRWNLLANATDGTYMRNKLIRDLAYDCVDAYEPQGEFVELFLNGAYQGLYLVTEVVEIAENRIEIEPEENWFVEMELDFRAREDETQMITEKGQIFIIHSESVVTDAQKAEVLERLNDIESALFSEDGISSISNRSLSELIDLESFAEAWLIEELSGDHDIGITSQFLYAGKDRDALWYSGPAWDFDGIMTNVNTPMYAVPEALTSSIEMSRPKENKNQNRWLAALWRHEDFRQLVIEKYKTVFRERSYRLLDEDIEKHVQKIQRSAQLDAFRWQEERLSWFFTLPKELHIPEEGGDMQGGIPFRCAWM